MTGLVVDTWSSHLLALPNMTVWLTFCCLLMVLMLQNQVFVGETRMESCCRIVFTLALSRLKLDPFLWMPIMKTFSAYFVVVVQHWSVYSLQEQTCHSQRRSCRAVWTAAVQQCEPCTVPPVSDQCCSVVYHRDIHMSLCWFINTLTTLYWWTSSLLVFTALPTRSRCWWKNLQLWNKCIKYYTNVKTFRAVRLAREQLWCVCVCVC